MEKFSLACGSAALSSVNQARPVALLIFLKKLQKSSNAGWK
jgi:hypothetical protein